MAGLTNVAFWRNFLGQAPDWYKAVIIAFLLINPVLFLLTPFGAGWLLVIEFIFKSILRTARSPPRSITIIF